MILESVAAAILISGANYMDYNSSKYALNNPSAIEMNILMGSNGERMELIKLGAITGEMIVFQKLNKNHKKLSWIWVAGIVGTNLVLAHHNNHMRVR